MATEPEGKVVNLEPVLGTGHTSLVRLTSSRNRYVHVHVCTYMYYMFTLFLACSWNIGAI